MELKFWGVRGSIPAPLSAPEIKEKIRKSLVLSRNVDVSTDEKMEFFLNQLPLSVYGTIGGNTSCVSIEENGQILIFDMGSGAKWLGEDLITRFPEGKTIHIFISHTHWDHIQGLPFFLPLYNPKFTLIFYSPKEDLQERLTFQQKTEFFPIILKQTGSAKLFKTIKEHDHLTILPDIHIDVHKLIHPGDSYAYKATSRNRSIVYATDTEFYKIDKGFIDDITQSWNNADILIFDSQYTPEEYMKKLNWGHSSSTIAVDIALACSVKTLILFHHEPLYSDAFILTTAQKAKEYLDFIKPEYNLEIISAYEGLSITI